jgi:hypothetical protein
MGCAMQVSSKGQGLAISAVWTVHLWFGRLYPVIPVNESKKMPTTGYRLGAGAEGCETEMAHKTRGLAGKMVGPNGLEPSTSSVSRKRSNQTELRACRQTVAVSILMAAADYGNVWSRADSVIAAGEFLVPSITRRLTMLKSYNLSQ